MNQKISVRQMLEKALYRGGKRVKLRPGLEGSVMNMGHELTIGPNLFAGLQLRLDTLCDWIKNPKGLYIPIAAHQGHNGVTIEGKNHMLDVTFGNSSPVTQVDPWYIGLINQSPTPTLAEADTLASHAGWSELTDYAGNRVAWDDANAASKIKGTTTTSDFTFNASGSCHGIMVASVATGTSGVLWATGGFDASVTFVNTDVLRVTYSVQL